MDCKSLVRSKSHVHDVISHPTTLVFVDSGRIVNLYTHGRLTLLDVFTAMEQLVQAPSACQHNALISTEICSETIASDIRGTHRVKRMLDQKSIEMKRVLIRQCL